VPADDVALATDGRTGLKVSWKLVDEVGLAPTVRVWPEVGAVPAGNAAAEEVTSATEAAAASAATTAVALVRRLVLRMR
jgi:hypothetical protein